VSQQEFTLDFSASPVTEVKRGRGRPPGSKSKKNVAASVTEPVKEIEAVPTAEDIARWKRDDESKGQEPQHTVTVQVEERGDVLGVAITDSQPVTSVAVVQRPSANRTAWQQRPTTSRIIYLDIETVPDFSRLHLFDLPELPTLPAEDSDDALMSVDEFLSQDLKTIEQWFAKHNPPERWVWDAFLKERESKKPRKGLFDAIDTHNKRIESIAGASEERSKLLSTTPEYCRVAALGWALGDAEPTSIVAVDPAKERTILETFWSLIQKHAPVVGYNVLGFDLTVLRVRSAMLNVNPTVNLSDVKPWEQLRICDLMTARYPKQAAKKLKDLARLYGINVPAGECDGSRVLDMVQAGQADELAAYVTSDVHVSRELHKRWRGLFVV